MAFVAPQCFPPFPGMQLIPHAVGWTDILGVELQQDYMTELTGLLRQVQFYSPEPQNIFRAFNLTPLSQVKVVLLGQEPYIEKRAKILGEPLKANGLAFASNEQTPPRSLQNIFRKLQQEYPGYMLPPHNDLEIWAREGVLLLNTYLTYQICEVDINLAVKKLWKKFTDAVIKIISDNCSGVVFILLGIDAQNKIPRIDQKRHAIVQAGHPSPQAVNTGGNFLDVNCPIFSLTNEKLAKFNKPPVDWRLVR